MTSFKIVKNRHESREKEEYPMQDSVVSGDKYVAQIHVHGESNWFSHNNEDTLRNMVLRHYPGAIEE